MRIGFKDRRSGLRSGHGADGVPGTASTSHGPIGPARSPRLDGYADLEVVGHGASATVYSATQEGYDRRVAVKVLNIDISDRRAQRRFQRERALNGRLSAHPNVVTVLDSGFVDGRYPYLAMEFFDLGSLAEQLRRRGPFDVADALHIGVRIAGALASAHQLGVLHRDVKPQNILQSRFGEPALADFGIAAILELEHSLTAALTPMHAAPELLEGADPSESADVYALSSTIFTILAGSPPFAGPPGEGMLAQLLRITTSDLPMLARNDVPSSLTDVLRAAMAKRPDERIASATDLGAALQNVQRELGLTVTALPVESRVDRATHERTALGTPTSPADLDPAPSAPLPSAPSPSAPVLAPPSARQPVTVMNATAQRALIVDELTADVPVPDAADAADEVAVIALVDAHTVSARHVAPSRPEPPTRRRWLPIAMYSLASVIGIVGVAALTIALAPGHRSHRVATSPTTAATTTTSPPSTVPVDVNALKPTDVKTSTAVDPVLLTWTDHANGRLQFLVYTYPKELGVGPILTKAGATEQAVAGVGPTTQACFIVAAVVSLGQDQTAAKTANSATTCINGAVAKVASP